MERKSNHVLRPAMLPCLGFGPLDADTNRLDFLEVFAGQGCDLGFKCLASKSSVVSFGMECWTPEP